MDNQQSSYPIILLFVAAMVALGAGTFFVARKPNPGGMWWDVEQNGFAWAGFVFAWLALVVFVIMAIAYAKTVDAKTYEQKLDAVTRLAQAMPSLRTDSTRAFLAVLSGGSLPEKSGGGKVEIDGVLVDIAAAFRYVALYKDGELMTPVRDMKGKKAQTAAVVNYLDRLGFVRKGNPGSPPVMDDREGAIEALRGLAG